MANKSIPDGDLDFAKMARNFASALDRDPLRYCFERAEVDMLLPLVSDFEAKLQAARHKFRRSTQSVMQKDDSRQRLQRMIEKFARLIRVNDTVSDSDKSLVGIVTRAGTWKKGACPNEAPPLSYHGAEYQKNSPVKYHVLRYDQAIGRKGRAKPAGCARLELFIGYVAPDAPIPKHPEELPGGCWRWLRSFTRCPIEVAFPVPSQPMRVVYWACWSNSTGECGPMSKTVVADLEGAGQPMLPGAKRQTVIITSAMKQLPDSAAIIEPGRLLGDEGAEAA